MSLKNLIFFFWIFYFYSPTIFAYETFSTGARYIGLAGTSAAIPDLWGVGHNQACFADQKYTTAAVFHERRYAVQELSTSAAILAVPVKSGVFGVQYSYFGYNVYHQSKMGLAFSRRINEKLSTGIMLDYYQSFLSTHGATSYNLAAEFGLLASPISSVDIGVHVLNPFPQQATQMVNTYIPSTLTFGMAWHQSKKFLLSGEFEKELHTSPVYKVAAEFSATEKFLLRTGILTNPVQWASGIGYSFGNFTIDLSFQTHPVLGITPAFSMNYIFK